ncbi:MAG: alkaline phosphatase [Thermoleophilia bacterium]|nr:alkaline phosphatase [Thermoleophilia bacterium]
MAALLLAGAVGTATRPPTLTAVGDIASCSSDGDEQTAALVNTLPGPIAVLGDIAYESGTREELSRCFLPPWGRFLPRIRAALGNREYVADGAAAAIDLFKLPANGWYSYSIGAWHVIVLNSNCWKIGGCERGSPQWRWLQADLAAHHNRCTLAYWHHPRFSSGFHGSDTAYAPFWELLARAKADVVLQGHDHHYERFAPLRSIRSFVVGTGGKSHYPTLLPRPGSVVRNSDTYGVLRLTLRPTAYDWKFLPVSDGSFSDAGTARCR